MADMPQVFRPIPRRAFDLTPASTNSSVPPSPPPEYVNPDLLMDKRYDWSPTPSRTRSILNLTSSTLLGIYSPTGHEATRDETSTPWGTGAQTPSHRRSVDGSRPQASTLNWNAQTQRPQAPRRRTKTSLPQLLLRTILLFSFGIAYGAIITQLHYSQNITQVKVPGVDGLSWYRHLAWGVSGVLLGNALPWMDTKWDNFTAASGVEDTTDWDYQSSQVSSGDTHGRSDNNLEKGLKSDWLSAVRSIGAFVGIAFAVRKLHWQSTLQVSLTLAMANPVLWYLIDRSKPGFAFSTAVGITGTFVLLVVNPELVPLPATRQQPGELSESVGVFIWMASILFCTSLCFGAIGRKVQS